MGLGKLLKRGLARARVNLLLWDDVYNRDQNGVTPLHTAAFNGRTNVIEAAVAAGVDIEARDHRGNTPLHAASSAGQTQTVRMLTSANIDIDATTENGFTAIYWAAWKDPIQCKYSPMLVLTLT